MTEQRLPLTDAALKAALRQRAAGSSDHADRLVGDVLAAVDQLPQRHGLTAMPLQFALASAAVLVVTVVGGALLFAPDAGPAGSHGSLPSRSPISDADLGVFAPVRGWVVFPVGDHLEGVDPDDPSLRVTIEPGDLGLGTTVMPAGWSADGSKLALTDQFNGKLYVMDGSGSLVQVPLADLPNVVRGCCSFVTHAWLSPDGTKGLVGASADLRRSRPGGLYILDLDDISRSRLVPTEAMGGFVWSPDGAQAAAAWSQGGDVDTPAVGIIDLTSGHRRELVSGWRLIRQLAWSPDGSQLLMVAGRDAAGNPENDAGNRLMQPQPADLYLIDIDDARVREIASGHYVAAAWSPDGTQIAAIDYPGRREVVVINADGSGGRRVLAELDSDDLFTGVVWHPVPAR